MNKINFQQVGGFPLETNTLDEIQKAYTIFNAYGELAGNKSIISGCETQGTTVSDGFIYLEGELLEFRGGEKQSTIVVVQEEVSVEFEDKTLKPAYFTRYATFGTSGDSVAWDDFKRFYVSQPIYKEVKWVSRDVTNADLPRGWYIADGNNGTDNVLGRMIVARDQTDANFWYIGQKGGESEVTLTVNQMPKHRHGMEDGAGGDDGAGRVTAGNDYGTQSLANAYTKEVGGGQAHNNLPPYIVMLPIQFIGG